MLTFFIYLLLTIFIIVSLLIVLVTLMQRPKSEGLGAAFGGGMTENFFGAQTTNVLANFTRWMAGIFFGLALILSVLYAKQSNSNKKSAIQQNLLSAPKPPATPAVAPKTAPAVKPTAPDAEKVPAEVEPAAPDAAKAPGQAEPAPAPKASETKDVKEAPAPAEPKPEPAAPAPAEEKPATPEPSQVPK